MLLFVMLIQANIRENVNLLHHNILDLRKKVVLADRPRRERGATRASPTEGVERLDSIQKIVCLLCVVSFCIRAHQGKYRNLSLKAVLVLMIKINSRQQIHES